MWPQMWFDSSGDTCFTKLNHKVHNSLIQLIAVITPDRARTSSVYSRSVAVRFCTVIVHVFNSTFICGIGPYSS